MSASLMSLRDDPVSVLEKRLTADEPDRDIQRDVLANGVILSAPYFLGGRNLAPVVDASVHDCLYRLDRWT